MKCNVGTIDRLVRIIIGLVIAILGVMYDSWWGLISIVFIVTGLFSFCPLYLAFNLSTRKKEE